MSIYYKDLKDIKTPHVYVFLTNDAGSHGSDSAVIARDRYGSPIGHSSGPHTSIKGSSYAISIKESSLIKYKPLQTILESINTLYWVAMYDLDRTYVLSDLSKGLRKEEATEVYRFCKQLFVNKNDKVKFYIPVSWK